MGINKKKLLAISKFNNADDVFTGTGLQDENIGLHAGKVKGVGRRCG